MHEKPKLVSTDPIDIEIVYGAEKISASSPATEAFNHTAYLTKQQTGSVEKMAQAYLAVGPGIHYINENNTLSLRETSIRAAAKHLPKEVVRHGTLQESDADTPSTFVYFGNLAIQGRMADDAEIEAARVEAKNYRDMMEQRRRDAITAKDESKVDYSGYDHVHIAVGDKEYFLNFDLPPAHLAYRALLSIHGFSPGQRLIWEEFDRSLWDAMPTTERTLLGIKEAEVFIAGPGPIKTMTLDFAREVARPLGLITHSNYEYSRTDAPFDLQLHSIPNPDNYGGRAVPIVPPGAPRAILEILRNGAGAMDTENAASHKEKLITLIESPGWEPEHAVEALDFIMSSVGKIALLQLYAKDGRSREEQAVQAEEMLYNLHNRVRRVLGMPAYYSARRNRTIAGNHGTGTHKVRQTGGRVESSTTKEERLKRWALGRVSSLQSRST